MHVVELQGEYIQRMNDEELVKFCRDNKHMKIERNPDGSIVLRPLHALQSGSVVSKVAYQLVEWERQNEDWGECLLSVGFILPNGAMRSPNIAFINKEKVKQIREKGKDTFPHTCLDFLIEVKSEWDLIRDKQAKMEEWIANGCRLAWLIDPEEEKVYIYREDGSIDEMEGFDKKVSGEDVLSGFELDLRELRV